MALISVSELQTLITQTVQQPRERQTEAVALQQALGRVLAQDVVSQINVPSQNVSAMDGYALPRAAKEHEFFQLVGESAAGKPFSGSLKGNECIRIMTGAVVPSDCVTVIMQENTESRDSGSLKILQDTPEGNNIRMAGEEITQGQTVLVRGRMLRDADVMLLAALGLGEVLVYQRLRVAVLSTGDELIEAGKPLQTGQIYDSNRPMLMARLASLPIEIIDLGKIDDDLNSVKTALIQAAEQTDVVITSGGVSVGDYDYLRQVVEEIGQIHHYKVAMKPGKPFVFGRLGEQQAWYFGLPGNPISGFVGFDMFVKTALWQLCGASEMPQPLRFQAALTAPVKKAVGRMDIQRATITRQTDGSWTVAPCGSQDSHRILGISQANAYMLLPQNSGSLNVGDAVEVQPFEQAFL
ncbi:gephyrin-like molybdotransferase Glp [Neisseriaceae bacterium B1]